MAADEMNEPTHVRIAVDVDLEKLSNWLRPALLSQGSVRDAVDHYLMVAADELTLDSGPLTVVADEPPSTAPQPAAGVVIPAERLQAFWDELTLLYDKVCTSPGGVEVEKFREVRNHWHGWVAAYAQLLHLPVDDVYAALDLGSMVPPISAPRSWKRGQ